MDSVFLSFDADSAGRQVGNAILSDSPEQLYDISQKIQHGNDVVFAWAQKWGGKCYSSGGDQGLFQIPSEAISEVEQIRKDYHFATGLTISVGIGNTLSESGKALLVAKFKGKDQIVIYDPSIEIEILEAQNRVAQGSGSQEEQKLSEAYLKPKEDTAMDENKSEMHDCQYCQEMPDDPDHCQHCHDVDSDDDCQYCREADAQGEEGHEHTGDDCEYCRQAEEDAIDSHTHEDGGEEDCPYCQNMDQESDGSDDSTPQATDGPNTQEPTTQESQTPTDPETNPPFLEKPDINDGMAPGIAPDTDMPSPENTKLDQQPGQQDIAGDSGNIFDQDEQSNEAMQQIVSAIDDGSEPTDSEMGSIDDEELPPAGSMEDNVSRPENYDENVPGDMGLAEDEVPQEGPDLSAVLKEGLDNHAGNIQKEKITQMVGQALEEFKGCKPILEKAREQAPQLYSASINMLKAMITMAEALGLAGEDEEQEIDEDFPSEGDSKDGEMQPASDMDEQSTDGQDRPDNRTPAHFQHPSKHAPAKEEGNPPPKPVNQQE